eukprot:gene1810-biopygen2518
MPGLPTRRPTVNQAQLALAGTFGSPASSGSPSDHTSAAPRAAAASTNAARSRAATAGQATPEFCSPSGSPAALDRRCDGSVNPPP